jgi:hypothetical protein
MLRAFGVESESLVAPKKEPAEEAVPADGDAAARYARRLDARRLGWDFRHVPNEGR